MQMHLKQDLKNGVALQLKTKALIGLVVALTLGSGAFTQSPVSHNEYSSQAPVEFRLPLVLTQFNVTISNGKVNVSWITGKEKQLSHFTIERSFNGVDFVAVGTIKAKGNSNVKINYHFADQLSSSTKGVICYRLKMVDTEQRYQNSNVEVVRIGESKDAVSILAYPNPVTSELRVTLPEAWQDKQVVFELYNINGQIVKQLVNTNASQTEVMNVSDISPGLYVMKVSNANETSVQRIVKKS